MGNSDRAVLGNSSSATGGSLLGIAARRPAANAGQNPIMQAHITGRCYAARRRLEH